MDRLHVMVAVLRDGQGRVLINQRPAGKRQAGRWEFPGGKLEQGEDRLAGLRRELHEELGVTVGLATPLIAINHDYEDFAVHLDVFEVADWHGEPHGHEGQALAWVHPEALPQQDILEADRPVIQAIRLPDRLLVTPEPRDQRRFLASIDAALARGVTMIQLRAHSLDDSGYLELAEVVLTRCRDKGACLLLNRDPGMLDSIDADGIHLSSARLQRLEQRPVPGNKWLSASCHSQQQLLQAQRIDADFALLGPVQPTRSHPEAEVLGWERFAELVAAAGIPVYALGGMEADMPGRVRSLGGQGIAAIRSLWPDR